MEGGDRAKKTYDACAPAYDDFKPWLHVERWTGLLGKAQEAGLQAIGSSMWAAERATAFIAMLERGWKVTACDISPQMLDFARERADRRAELFEGAMRELPDFGEFDLIWAVNDAINYLPSVGELEAALAGMRQNLGPGRAGVCSGEDRRPKTVFPQE